MKKLVVFFLFIFLVTGCGNKIEHKPQKEINHIEEPKEEEIIIPEYIDNNITPISFYQLNGNVLKKLYTIKGNYQALDDVGIFQVYPSNLEEIQLTKNYSVSYVEEWNKYREQYPIHIGFSLSFTLSNGEEIHYNILNPDQAMSKWEYFMAYLYDDYVNRNKSFYSHIEMNEFTDSSFVTAIKLQCGAYFLDINSPVTFQVFTYDSEDDFLDGKYRGNSQSSMTICLNSLC